MRPERSSRSRNAMPPWPRRACRRPASRWRASVSAPASRPSCAARTPAIDSTPSNACGNGSIPCSRRRSSLARRWASRSSAMTAGSLEADVDLGDLVLLLLAVGQHDGDLFAALVTHQRLADRGLVGDLLLARIGLGGADDRELDGLALVVLEVDDRPHADGVGRHALGIDDLGQAQAVLQLHDALLEHRLLVLGVVVLGVLGDVAELPRFLDAVGYRSAAVPRQLVELVLELLESFRGEDDVLGHA